ncbi:MAG: aminopeptidase P family protein [Clostridia bacterium]|nr:aminopeptidase P family protein [Clostridia bacterium]
MQNNVTTVKTAEEIAKIVKAAEIIDDVFDYILGELKAGVTEIEIADKIKAKVLELGGSDVSFDTIVAFGAGGCEPHHVPTDTKLKWGDLITIDMGAIYDGYCSDFTRTMAYGDITDEQRKVYEIVLKAYELGMDGVKEGASCKAVDALTRDYISLCGYGDNYIHGTGHGVGTEIHEKPTVNPRSEEFLKNGEVITIEPGIYLQDKLGVRIENMIIVGTKGPVSRQPVELITIK